MAAQITLRENLENFVAATDSGLQCLPDVSSLSPPDNGVTLLDSKSEIFLAYLQALALRNLSVIRSIKDGADAESARRISREITKTLVEHRVYLERGVRPLEQKLQYQIERVVKAADDEERTKSQGAIKKMTSPDRAQNDGPHESSDDDSDESDGSEDADLDATSFRPNPRAMTSSSSKPTEVRGEKSTSDGIYRPPRISATSMPEPDRRERTERRPARSRTLDEYVSTELSTAPLAEPSIGSNIAQGGRRNKSARQLADEKERRDYEETNLVRLPKESKKDRAKKGLRGRDAAGGYGGEDWRDLGDSLDRIGQLTRRKNKDSALDRSRKRRATEDSPRDAGIGSAFDVKKRRMFKKR